VLALVLGGLCMAWYQQRLVETYLAEQRAAQVGMRDAIADEDADDESDEDTSSAATTYATIEFGPAARLQSRAPGGDATAPTAHVGAPPPARTLAPTATAETRQPAPEPAPQHAPAPTLRGALANVVFLRGRFAREGAGFVLDLPAHFHALAAVDVRRVEAALGVGADAREVGWVMHENVSLADPGAWHVSLRWHDDLRLVPQSEPPDGERLLRGTGATTRSGNRLLGSGGDLIGFAVAPAIDAGVVDWVEERLPHNAASSVLDCHALRSGRAGTVEFSIVGAQAGSQAACVAVVRLLAHRASFAAASSVVAAVTPRTCTLAELL